MIDDMIDICSGKMTLAQLTKEIHHYMYMYEPTKMTIEIERDDKLKGLRSTIYIPKDDFKKDLKY